MPHPIIYVDRSRIVEGRVQELKRGLRALVEFVERHEPRLISYGFFLDEARSRMTVIAIHPDTASLEFHMDVAGPEFRKLKDLVELTEIEVYGPMSESALAPLREKTRMLGGGGKVVVLEAEAGFSRLHG